MKNLALLALATLGPSLQTNGDEKSKFAGELGAIIKEAQAKLDEQSRVAAISEATQLLAQMAAVKQINRNTAKQAELSLKQTTEANVEIDRLFAYGNATGNFVPLLIKLGYGTAPTSGFTPEQVKALTDGDKDWKPEAKS